MLPFGKPSKKKFANQLRELFAQHGRSMDYDSKEFRLVQADGDLVFNLGNVFNEHCQLDKADREQHLLNLVTAMTGTDLPETFTEAESSLRPKIWTRSTFEIMQLESRLTNSPALDLPLIPLGEHLYSTVVFDTPTSMRSINSSELDEWGVGYYPALESACRNLEETTLAWAKIGDGFHSAVSGDSYDACRILLTDRIRSLEVIGRPVAAVPNRDSMFVAGSEDEQSLDILFAMVEDAIREQPRPLSPLPLILNEEDEWVDWVPHRNHAFRSRYDLLAVQFFGELYAQQKHFLDQVNEKELVDVFVGSVMAFSKDEEVITVSSWGEGVDALLPKTKFICIAKETGDSATVEWEPAREIVGDLMVDDAEHYPMRYRVREFPSDEQFAQLKAADSMS